jgi:uncharacterized protein involved in exopolysaccharide biosynthesis
MTGSSVFVPADGGGGQRLVPLPPADPQPLSLRQVLALLRRHRVLFVLLPLLCGALAAAIALTIPAQFRSTLAVMPQASKAQLSQLSGLAAQFGVNVGGGSSTESPDLYAELIGSRQILGALADSTFRTQDGRSVRLADLLEVEPAPPAIRREQTIKRLRDLVQASVGLRTSAVNVTVIAPDPRVAQRMGELILQLLGEFNLRSRQMSAEAERRFVAGQLAEARGRLEAAEDRLRLWLERNRSYELSPQLTFEKERLEREWQMQQSIYSTLAQSLEQARIEAVRNTPGLVVVEEPNLPAMRDPRQLGVKMVVGMVLGLLVAAVWGIIADAIARERSQARAEAPADGVGAVGSPRSGALASASGD